MRGGHSLRRYLELELYFEAEIISSLPPSNEPVRRGIEIRIDRQSALSLCVNSRLQKRLVAFLVL